MEIGSRHEQKPFKALLISNLKHKNARMTLLTFQLTLNGDFSSQPFKLALLMLFGGKIIFISRCSGLRSPQ